MRCGGPTRAFRSSGRISSESEGRARTVARSPRAKANRGFQPRARQLTPSAIGRTMPTEGLLSQAKRLIVGEPIPSHLAHHERLSRFTGLAVLSSDPLVVSRLRDRGNLTGARARRSRHAHAGYAYRLCDCQHSRDRRLFVSANHPRVSQWRRRLHRREGQPR